LAESAPASNEAGASTDQAPGGIPHQVGELHRLLVESVTDYAIFAIDPKGYILSWNPGAERFKGYTADEIIGKHFSIFYPPERIAEGFPEHELREAARVGRFEDEGWRIRKDGSRFWANVVLTALHDASGRLIAYAKVTRDLSERREAEESLRISEERFRLLVQGVKDYAIFMLDPTGHVTTWNDGAQRIKGYTADEIIGKHFSIFYTPEDLASGKPARELEVATRTGVYEEEGWRLRRDGSRLWASVLITALRVDGRLAGFAKVTRDLTERRAAQERALDDARRVAAEEAARQVAEATRERTERLQALTAALSAAHTLPEIIRVVFDNGLTSAGASAGALGLVDESGTTLRIVGDAGYHHLPAWVRQVGVADDLPMSEAARTGRPVICRSRAERDARFPKLAETLAPYETTVVLPLSVRGRTIGVLALHRRATEPLADTALDFMYAFAQQTAQALERAMLYDAEQAARLRADEANRGKSEFLAAMSHELRTPLNAIAGYADLIAMGLRGPVTAQQHEDLARIKRSQQHLLHLINDILNFSRVEAGQATYEYGPIVICEVLEAVGQMIAPLAAAKGLQFSVSKCSSDVVVWADKSKVEQILLNLLSNAVKFTPAGSVTLGCGEESSECVTIEVRDSGVGIPSDQVHRIFEPFVQIGRSLINSGEGTGLGLAISRDLARAMGGEIAVESAADGGSLFSLSLPRRPKQIDESTT
jgi:PAS domain S-box-containing protein